jgi:hypothetical protein
MSLQGVMCLSILLIPIIAYVCYLLFSSARTRASGSSPLNTLLSADDNDLQLYRMEQKRKIDRIKASHGFRKVRGEYTSRE